jgi:Hydantoinase/oxoprolinase N-terminal region/Hydantoinase B/oxoprolinase
MTYRLGVDVGGTFTDLLLVDEDTGDTHRGKTPSTPADQSVGVLVGIEKVCMLAGIEPAQIDHVMHGTTIATNAVLEGKGARVGLIVTRGYRQVLQVARSFVPGGLAAWIVWPKPEPLAALENTVEAVERVGGQGRRGRAVGRGRLAAEAGVPAGAGRGLGHRRAHQLLRQPGANPSRPRRSVTMATLVETATTPLGRFDVDPVTVDIIENALRNARYEMDAVLFRTAMSPGIREQHDDSPSSAIPPARWSSASSDCPSRTSWPASTARSRRATSS